MLKLLKKELKLNVPLPLYLFTLLATMILIPNYPAIVGVGYTVMQVFVYLQFCAANKSLQFTSVLPVKRKDIVTSTTLVVVFFQMLNVVLSLILLVPYRFVYPKGTIVGIDGNLTFIAICLLCFAAFDAAFLPGYFKTGYKYGFPLLWGLVSFVLTYLVSETLIQAIPAINKVLDGLNPEYIWVRAVTLVVAAAIYVFAVVLANNAAAKRFEKVNL